MQFILLQAWSCDPARVIGGYGGLHNQGGTGSHAPPSPGRRALSIADKAYTHSRLLQRGRNILYGTAAAVATAAAPAAASSSGSTSRRDTLYGIASFAIPNSSVPHRLNGTERAGTNTFDTSSHVAASPGHRVLSFGDSRLGLDIISRQFRQPSSQPSC